MLIIAQYLCYDDGNGIVFGWYLTNYVSDYRQSRKICVRPYQVSAQIKFHIQRWSQKTFIYLIFLRILFDMK